MRVLCYNTFEREEACTYQDVNHECYGPGFISCLVSWNDREPKYDIRDWSPDGKIMGKGVTLSKEELVALRELLIKMGE